jgi:hypothetical protein
MSRFTMLTMVAVALILAHAPALAVPQVLQYQGRLTDAAGQPLTEPADVTFSLYDEADSEEPLWTQTFEQLPLDNGRFSVLLGGDDAPFTPELVAALDEGADLFLGLQVGEDPEMTPRQQIASVAYALRADHAATVDAVVGMPGIAFHAVHREVVDPGASVSVVSVTLTTPADGYVLVTASGTLVLDNTSGEGARSHANIGEVSDAIPETTMGLVIADVDVSANEALHYVPFHSQRVYEKPAGEHTFHLNVRNISGSGQVAANRPSLTALFFPTAYGDAEIETAPPAAPDAR